MNEALNLNRRFEAGSGPNGPTKIAEAMARQSETGALGKSENE